MPLHSDRDVIFFLKPLPFTGELFAYCLAYAAERYGVLVHAALCHATHYHLVCTDPRGELPRFQQLMNVLLARGLNTFLGRGENAFAPGSYSAVELHDRETIEETLVYVLTNVTKDGVLRRPEDWPGVRTLAAHVGAYALRGRRPRRFFAEDTTLPEEVRLLIALPPGVAVADGPAFRQRLSGRVEERIAKILAERRAKGRQRFIGLRGVTAVDPRDRAGETWPTFERNPRVACRDVERRKALLRGLRAWRGAYHAAWERWHEGAHRTAFPEGSYWMVVAHRARVGPAPPLLEAA